MTWGQGSNIPKSVKDTVRRRDGAKGGCQLQYPGICTGRIDEFDHIDGLADQGRQRNDKRVTAAELQGVCEPCHERKTEQQRLAGIARAVEMRARCPSGTAIENHTQERSIECRSAKLN
ncbi:hypothetical protein B1R94_26030 [Mycolicibacterium litorale]|nr:hypothetical protein B1R94_26030 [Mycolicibacterium litorale]